MSSVNITCQIYQVHKLTKVTTRSWNTQNIESFPPPHGPRRLMRLCMSLTTCMKFGRKLSRGALGGVWVGRSQKSVKNAISAVTVRWDAGTLTLTVSPATHFIFHESEWMDGVSFTTFTPENYCPGHGKNFFFSCRWGPTTKITTADTFYLTLMLINGAFNFATSRYTVCCLIISSWNEISAPALVIGRMQ